MVPNPDVGGREKILKVHMRKVPLAPDVDPRVLARGTPGFSGADLANLVNEAALRAARVGKRLVTMGDFEYAKDKVLMGTERRSMAMTDEEKTLTAYHEAGHALVAMHVPKSDPLHKVTIIPRGRALGVTMQLPERDHLSHTKQYLESRLAIMFGGRLAEELVFGPENVTTGAASDIQVATQTARGMITAYGMSEKLGRVRYQANEQEVFLGHAVTQTQNVSEATAAAHRPGGPPPDRGGRRPRPHDPDGASRGPAHDLQGAARVRDAEQRRDRHDPARREGRARRHRRRRHVRSPSPCLGPDQHRPGAGRQSRASAGRLTRRFAGLALDRPLVMAIVNVTPDSFSDGGERLDPARAIDDGLRFVAEGADILDVGGESTRPGSAAVSPEEECRRVLPVVEGLVRQGAVVSLDTRRALVARSRPGGRCADRQRRVGVAGRRGDVAAGRPTQGSRRADAPSRPAGGALCRPGL